jgi:hypothetical protein
MKKYITAFFVIVMLILTVLIFFPKKYCLRCRLFTGDQKNYSSDGGILLIQDSDKYGYKMPLYVNGVLNNYFIDSGSTDLTTSDFGNKNNLKKSSRANRTKNYAGGVKETVTYYDGNVQVPNHKTSSITYGISTVKTNTPADYMVGLCKNVGSNDISFVDQMGIHLITFNFTHKPSIYFNTVPAICTEDKIVAKTRLLKYSDLVADGIVLVENIDYYTIEVSGYRDVKYLTIDTGSTFTLLTDPPSDGSNIEFKTTYGKLVANNKNIKLNSADLYHNKKTDSTVGVFGNKDMAGYYTVLDYKNNMFTMYKV